jgi:putative addiction module component (TIGR02574 family)
MIQMQEILDLSSAERILLMEKIWDSLDHNAIVTTSSQEDELDRRFERYQKGETTFVSWEDIKSELNAGKF